MILVVLVVFVVFLVAGRKGVRWSVARANGRSDAHEGHDAHEERDDDWFIAYSPEIPGANGQGRTKEAARASLAQAIALILEDRRTDGLRGVPPDAERETVIVR